MSRNLIVAPEVTEILSGAHIGQLESLVDDDDNVCQDCGEFILGDSAAVVVFADDRASVVKLAHPECLRSGVYPVPGLDSAMRKQIDEEPGLSMRTLLGRRRTSPQALVFLEPLVLLGSPDEDPLGVYAEGLGLAPISGEIEHIEPPHIEGLEIQRHPQGLGLRTPHGTEEIHADPESVTTWAKYAQTGAIVIVARGLGLGLSEPTIEAALALRPAWGGLVEVRGVS